MENLKIDNITGQNSTGAKPNDPLKFLTTSSIIGDAIFNGTGEALGKIRDIMIDITEGKK